MGSVRGSNESPRASASAPIGYSFKRSDRPATASVTRNRKRELDLSARENAELLSTRSSCRIRASRSFGKASIGVLHIISGLGQPIDLIHSVRYACGSVL